METFISTNMVKAGPEQRNSEEGYVVHFMNGDVSWCPEDVFKKTYLAIDTSNNTVTKENVDSFIKRIDIQVMGNKTVVVQATLVNGFVIVESSSCVDPKNFDINIGKDICMKKIKDKVWMLLGFLLQCCVNGFGK